MNIGSKQSIAFILGPRLNTQTQDIDIWVSNELVTYYDNSVYLPQFIESLKRELEYFISGEIPENYIAFKFGPTTDDASVRVKISKDKISLRCKLNNGSTVTLKTLTNEVICCYQECIKALSSNA